MAENTRPDATQRDANVKTTYIVYTCVCGPGCQCVNCVEARDGMRGQVSSRGKQRMREMDEYIEETCTQRRDGYGRI